MPTRCVVSVYRYDVTLLHVAFGRLSCGWHGDREVRNTVSGIANLMRFQNDDFVSRCSRCEPLAIVVSEGLSPADKLAHQYDSFYHQKRALVGW